MAREMGERCSVPSRGGHPPRLMGACCRPGRQRAAPCRIDGGPLPCNHTPSSSLVFGRTARGKGKRGGAYRSLRRWIRTKPVRAVPGGSLRYSAEHRSYDWPTRCHHAPETTHPELCTTGKHASEAQIVAYRGAASGRWHRRRSPTRGPCDRAPQYPLRSHLRQTPARPPAATQSVNLTEPRSLLVESPRGDDAPPPRQGRARAQASAGGQEKTPALAQA